MGEGGCFCTEGDGAQAVRREAEIKWTEMDVFLNEYQEDERSLVANFKPPDTTRGTVISSHSVISPFFFPSLFLIIVL